MRAFDPEVVDALWAAIEPLVPVPFDRHPLGCHRRRKSDRDCFFVMLVRLATGCSWEDAEHLTGVVVSDTTARERRDQWIAAGVFEAIATEAICGYDKIIGLDLSDVAVDGSLHKAPAGGEGTGKNPVVEPSSGGSGPSPPMRWASPSAGAHKAPTSMTCTSSNPPSTRSPARGLLVEIETLWLDRGYDGMATRQRLTERGIDDAMIAKHKRRKAGKGSKNPKLGLRWPVERTNSWLSNYGQLRRNTDRKTIHRLAQLALAIAVLLTAKLIDWRNRWSPPATPIR